METLKEYIDVFMTVPLATILLVFIYLNNKLMYTIINKLIDLLKKDRKDGSK